MTSSKIIVARQAGTATAFVPVIKALQSQNPMVFAYEHAQKVFIQFGIDAMLITCFKDAKDTLPQNSEQILLTGTSEQVDDDALWWQWAKDRGVKSIGFLDQWVNYWQRFTSKEGGGKFDITPDIIAVIDEIAKGALVKHGVGDEKIIITGTPAIDLLFETKTCFEKKHNQKTILFACDSIIFDDKFISDPPLDIALNMCVAAAKKCTKASEQIVILIKPHPRQENIELFKRFECDEAGLKVIVADKDRLEMLFSADIIISPTSMILYEATILGKPAISIQPDKHEVWDMPDKNEKIDVCITQDDIEKILKKYLDSNCENTQKYEQKEHVSEIFVERLGLI